MSAEKDVVFDPSGDVLLLLKKTVEPAAEENVERPQSPTGKADEDEANSEQSDDSPGAMTVEDPHLQEDILEVRVSSRHLALASRVFRVMFDGNFSEKVQPGSQQLTKVPLPEDHADAMLVILAVAHGLTRRVPRKVDMQLGFQIVILIDKYEFHEVTEVWTDLWFYDLAKAESWNLTDGELSKFIYISWVLRKEAEFTNFTKIALRRSPLREWVLPTPAFITDAITSRRKVLIKKCLNFFKALLITYQGAEPQCTRQANCDAMVLGNLAKLLTSAGLPTYVTPPQVHMSLEDLFSKVRAMQFTSLCQIRENEKPSGFGRSIETMECTLRDRVLDEVRRWEREAAGLSLKDLSTNVPSPSSIM